MRPAQPFLIVVALGAGALVTGACGDDGVSRAAEGPPPMSTGTSIAVTGTDGLRFEPDTLTVPAGEEITLTFSAETGLEHDFVIEDAADVGVAGTDGSTHDGGEAGEGDLHVVHAGSGQTTTATFRITEPGTYTVYCSVPGHRQGGMLATLTVEEST